MSTTAAKAMTELKSMRDRIDSILTELDKQEDRNGWDDDEIYEWGIAHQGCEHGEITRRFHAPANSSIHNVLRRLSLAGRCVRIKQLREGKNGRKRSVWIYYFGEPMPKEPRTK